MLHQAGHTSLALQIFEFIKTVCKQVEPEYDHVSCFFNFILFFFIYFLFWFLSIFLDVFDLVHIFANTEYAPDGGPATTPIFGPLFLTSLPLVTSAISPTPLSSVYINNELPSPPSEINFRSNQQLPLQRTPSPLSFYAISTAASPYVATPLSTSFNLFETFHNPPLTSPFTATQPSISPFSLPSSPLPSTPNPSSPSVYLQTFSSPSPSLLSPSPSIFLTTSPPSPSFDILENNDLGSILQQLQDGD